MILISVNGIPFEFDGSATMESVVKEVMKKPHFIRFTGVHKNSFLYIKNNQVVKHEELIEHEIEDGDKISITAITSGG